MRRQIGRIIDVLAVLAMCRAERDLHHSNPDDPGIVFPLLRKLNHSCFGIHAVSTFEYVTIVVWFFIRFDARKNHQLPANRAAAFGYGLRY
jgi:hypothetical protein